VRADVHVFTDWFYYVPLGILGMIRWVSWLIRRLPAALYRPWHNGHVEDISIVVPVYREDPEIFAKAIESWLANNVVEVILVIDASDRVCLEVASRYTDDHPVTIIVTDVPGKRDALKRGWDAARTPIVPIRLRLAFGNRLMKSTPGNGPSTCPPALGFSRL